MVVLQNYHFGGDKMENEAITVLTGLGTLCNALIWEERNGEPLNNGISRQLLFLIETNQF